ncbi:5-dehydro-4-deoxy-D-glucuronate isomerase [Glaciecola sp. KUL10]|uniref:5-dehydro-4-deoxy-D-glucuronate isomerase n=1 Tax=Glaciecola sp. (strain KUL10) TaxID=2161813 RepID=UPI000D7896BE|nr:5-dehydro-4-deoxy-D-glucuronate isomerase [Glaciecola sp. KUL10]GBL05959.1 5-keto-4-deoxyuronate isomerase [Glaciecola sp. KUL10]
MQIRHSTNPKDAKHYDTSRLREEYLIETLMVNDEITLIYSQIDRVITGGAVPKTKALTLSAGDALRASSFLQRRELGIINVGGTGTVTVGEQTYRLDRLDCLYIGRGKPDPAFSSDDAANPALFYMVSTPAHTEYPTSKSTQNDANPIHLGALETSNKRTIYQYIHEKGVQSCQLVMGLTILDIGSVWNTFPAHTHDRRMEVYFYFNLEENDRVMHLMGEPHETRHIVVKNHQAVLSPSWSIHSGAGTRNYGFIWAMAGENQAFDDMDAIDLDHFK